MRFTGILRKAIDLDDAPAQDLMRVLGFPADENDRQAYAVDQIQARWDAVDRYFNLESAAPDIWLLRAKALLSDIHALDASDAKFWPELATQLALRHIPGFAFRRADKKKHGAPREWTDERRAQLYADVEFLKKTTGMKIKDICQRLPRAKGYASRWGNCTGPGLCKQYSQAKALRRGLLFRCLLSGIQAGISGSDLDVIDAAIELHALKRPLAG